jgi:hypothetical protein
VYCHRDRDAKLCFHSSSSVVSKKQRLENKQKMIKLKISKQSINKNACNQILRTASEFQAIVVRKSSLYIILMDYKLQSKIFNLVFIVNRRSNVLMVTCLFPGFEKLPITKNGKTLMDVPMHSKTKLAPTLLTSSRQLFHFARAHVVCERSSPLTHVRLIVLFRDNVCR